MTAPRYLEFVYTNVFERTRRGILDEGALLSLEVALLRNPSLGRVERGTGGVRKMRLPLGGRGKSGGARVLYLYQPDRQRVFLLFAYTKSVQPVLSPQERLVVRRLVNDLKREP